MRAFSLKISFVLGLGAQMQPLGVAISGGFVMALLVLSTGLQLLYLRRGAARELAEHGVGLFTYKPFICKKIVNISSICW